MTQACYLNLVCVPCKRRSLEFFAGRMLNNVLLNLREFNRRDSDVADKLGFVLEDVLKELGSGAVELLP